MTTRERLIRQAARDDAEEGTVWRDRMEAWLTCPLTEREVNDALERIYQNSGPIYGRLTR